MSGTRGLVRVELYLIYTFVKKINPNLLNTSEIIPNFQEIVVYYKIQPS